MNRLFVVSLCVLCACQTHRVRHVSQRDSSYAQTATSMEHIEEATAQSIHQNWQWWSAESTAVVILPKGPVSYHPTRGFNGEATAILAYGSQSEHTALLHDHTTDQLAVQSSAHVRASETHTHSKEHESETDRQPLAGFSFRWLTAALLTGCVLLLIRYWYRRR